MGSVFNVRFNIRLYWCSCGCCRCSSRGRCCGRCSLSIPNHKCWKVLKNKLGNFLSPTPSPPQKKKVKKMFIKSGSSVLYFLQIPLENHQKKSLRFKPPQRPSSLRAPWDPPWDPWPSVKFCWSSRYVQPRSDLGKVRGARDLILHGFSLKRQYKKKGISKGRWILIKFKMYLRKEKWIYLKLFVSLDWLQGISGKKWIAKRICFF